MVDLDGRKCFNRRLRRNRTNRLYQIYIIVISQIRIQPPYHMKFDHASRGGRLRDFSYLFNRQCITILGFGMATECAYRTIPTQTLV